MTSLTTTAGISEAHTVDSDGYSRALLTRGTAWTVVGNAASYTQLTFTASGTGWGQVTGYFITTTSAGTAGTLMAVESFADGPYTINAGDSVKITPTITIE